MIFKILVLILLIPFNAFGWGMLNQQDAGSVAGGGTACDVPASIETGTTAGVKIANGNYYMVAQKFVAGCTISDATVTVKFDVNSLVVAAVQMPGYT